VSSGVDRAIALIDVAVSLNAARSTPELVQQDDYVVQNREAELQYGIFDPRDCWVQAGSENDLCAQPGRSAPVTPLAVDGGFLARA
jgi:hypothetical protein